MNPPRLKGQVFRNRAEQVVAFLREQMEGGVWEHRLPPERELAQQLGVSRWTLRAAIRELQSEGVIGTRSQAGTVIEPSPARRGARLSVGLVVNSKANLSQRRLLFMIEGIRHYLEVQGVPLEVHRIPYLQSGALSAHFRKLTQTVQHNSWVLVSPPESMQVWCAENGVPAVVAGVSSERAGLPSSSVDFRAVCRHAAGVMISRGHRRLAMILSRPEKSEDAQSQLGFREAVRESPHDLEVRYESHDATSEGVRRLVDRLMALPDRPTAWLICRQGSFTRFFTYLLHRQVRIPEELSILCRDADDYFDDFIPHPTFYRVNRPQLVHQTARLALRVALGQAQPQESATAMSELVVGETLGLLRQ